MTEDPIGFGGGDWNLYGYVGDAPVAACDASGLGIGRPRVGRIFLCFGPQRAMCLGVCTLAGLEMYDCYNEVHVAPLCVTLDVTCVCYGRGPGGGRRGKRPRPIPAIGSEAECSLKCAQESFGGGFSKIGWLRFLLFLAVRCLPIAVRPPKLTRHVAGASHAAQ